MCLAMEKLNLDKSYMGDLQPPPPPTVDNASIIATFATAQTAVYAGLADNWGCYGNSAIKQSTKHGL